MNVEAMRKHVRDLCERHEINIEWIRRPSSAQCFQGLSIIQIAPIRSPVTYAVALHELGHVLGRHQMSRSRLVRERWAWNWAKRNALMWTSRMDRTMQSSLDWYASRQWPPDPTFADLNPHLFSNESGR